MIAGKAALMTGSLRNSPKTMSRFALTKLLVSQLQNKEAVIGGIGFTNFDLYHAGHRAENFYMLGSMGHAFPIALGFALAQPSRLVVGLEGDGSILMQLGSLATIAAKRPRNLLLIVWDNGSYQITGGQVTTTATVADVVEIARACGIAKSDWAKDEAHFETLVKAGIHDGGPTLIGVKVDNAAAEKHTPRDPILIREAFMRGVNVREDLFAPVTSTENIKGV
jgi:thiamine pyrophosphate-dependent acetolactate synthase large subunit-like protein